MVPLEDTSRDFGPQKPTLDFCDFAQAHPSNKPVYYGRSELGLEFRKYSTQIHVSVLLLQKYSKNTFSAKNQCSNKH